MGAVKSTLYTTFGPPWLTGWAPGARPRPFFGLLRGQGGPRVRTGRLVQAFGNHFVSPNLIYTSSSGMVPFAAAERLREEGFRGPIVHNQNGMYYPAWYSGDYLAKNTELAAFVRLASYVVFQSDFCLRAFRELAPGAALPPHEVLLNPSEDLAAGSPPRWQGNPQLLVAGNLGHGGEHVLLPALRLFARAGKRWQASLVVLGEAPPALLASPEVRAALADVDAAGLKERVRFTGRYDLNGFLGTLGGRPLALHLRYKDACPNAVSEKLSLGIPHVYSRSGGTPELVGAAGVGVPVAESWTELVPVNDALLETAVDQALTNYDDLSRRARAEFEKRLTLEGYVRRHAEIFEKTLRR